MPSRGGEMGGSYGAVDNMRAPMDYNSDRGYEADRYALTAAQLD